MRLVLRLLTSVVALVLLFSSVWLFHIFVGANADPSSWLLPGDPTFTHVTDFPANQPPARSNTDCTQMDFTTTRHESKSGCMVSTALGLSDGEDLIYNNTSLAVPVIGYNNWQYTLQPVPHQSMVLSTSSAPFLGLTFHFYTHLSSDLTPHTDLQNNLWYTVSEPPNQEFPTMNGQPVSANPATLSYSSDGAWMIVENMQHAMLRINLATFDVVPFAPAINTGPSDYRTHTAYTTVSDDGRYATVVSNDFHYFKIYDLSTCVPSTLHPDYQGCQSRDLWPYVSTQVSGLKAVYSVRFTNDDNVNFDASYNYASSSSYSVARFNVTAPGQQEHALGYLAMGDSYISGQGTFVYKDGTDTANNTCHQSSLAYPSIIGQDLSDNYASVACSGAKTKDITGKGVENYDSDPIHGAQAKGMSNITYDDAIYSNFLPGYRIQLDFVQKYQPKIITLSVGGDNVDFSGIVKSCVSPAHTPQTGQTCYDSYAERLSLVHTIIGAYPDLQDTYRQILQVDPGVQLYVVGYPQVAVEGNCADNVRLNASEIQFSQDLVAYLDSTIQRAAKSVGAYYVDTQNALAEHRLCETQSSNVAINGFTVGGDNGALGINFIGNESYHPNPLGYQLLAAAILNKTDNLHAPMPAADDSAVAPSLNDSLAQTLLNGYQPDGTNIQTAVLDDTITPSMMLPHISAPFDVSGLVEGLVPNTKYLAYIHSTPTSLGMFTTDANGDLHGELTVPDGISPGFHTIHIYGPNIAGQQTDIFTIVYVAASNDDYDGDGVPNTADQCLVVPPSGQDVDKDGIDDACDPDIGAPPASTYPATATLTGNTILIGNPAQ